MLRVLALALVGLLATLAHPTASACPLEDCVPPIVVCQDAIPWMCFEMDPGEVVDWDAVRRLLGPCTCDPID